MVFATFNVADAVPPTPLAAEKLSNVMPATDALVILALVTVPSGSLALTFADAALPWFVVNDPGQVGAMGWLGGVTVTTTVQLAVCGVGESLFWYWILTL